MKSLSSKPLRYRSAILRTLSIALLACAATSCIFIGKTQQRIPTFTVSAPRPSAHKQLVIVLPGRGDDLNALRHSGIAATIQQHLPNADVVLVELTLAYYMEGDSVQRLHKEIVEPARAQGFRDISLAGASMGGMGVLMYERQYPHEMRNLILMAPYMGNGAIVKEVKAAGGLADWNAGPIPTQLNRDNVPREEWRLVQSWLLMDRTRTQSVWLVCGQSDRFHAAAGIVGAVLPPGHFVQPAGGHAWTVWRAGANEVFARIASSSK